MKLPHKSIMFPEVDLSDDDGAEGWENGEFQPAQVCGITAYKMVQQPGMHRKHWDLVRRLWTEAARAFEGGPDDFYRSWHYLNEHPVYWRFEPHPRLPRNHVLWLTHDYGFGSGGIDVEVVRVDDEGTPRNDDSLNTRTQIWLETGKWGLFPEERLGGHHDHWHDYKLDCGGATYEEAVIKLARNVWEKYGNDRRIADKD